MTWEITSIGFGEFIHMALVAVVLLTSDIGGFGAGGSVVFLAFLVGFLYVAGQSIMTAKLELAPLVLMFILFWAMFVPRVTVIVTDQVTNFAEPVDNVPIGIAAPGMLLTAVATFVTERYQLVFDTGSGEPLLSSNRFAYPLRLMLNLRDMQASNLGPTYTNNWQNYWSDCFYPALTNERVSIAEGEADPQYFFGQGDAFPASAFRAGQYTRRSVVGAGTSTLPCRAAADALWEDMAVETDGGGANGNEIRESLMTFLEGRAVGLPEKSVPDSTSTGVDSLPGSTSVAMENIRGNITSLISGVSEMRNFLAAQVVLNSAGSAAGNRFSGVESLLMTEMMERQRVSSATEASGFLRMVTIMMGLMQFLFIALTPIVAVVAIAKVSAGFKVYGSWLLLGLWSSSFLIIVTVIDYWAMLNVQRRWLQGELAGEALANLSLSGLASTYELVANTLTTANTFMVAAPLITLAMLTGSIYPMAALASRLSGGPEIGNIPGSTVFRDKGMAEIGAAVEAPSAYGHSAGTLPVDRSMDTSVDVQRTAQDGYELASRNELQARDSLGSRLETSTSDVGQYIRNTGEGYTGQEAQARMQSASSSFVSSLTAGTGMSEAAKTAFSQEISAQAQGGLQLSIPKIAGIAGNLGGSTNVAGTDRQAFETVQNRLQSYQDSSQNIDSIQGQELTQFATNWSSHIGAIDQQAASQIEAETQTYETASTVSQSASENFRRAENLGSGSSISQTQIQAAMSAGRFGYGGTGGQAPAITAALAAANAKGFQLSRDQVEAIAADGIMEMPNSWTAPEHRVPAAMMAMSAAQHAMLDEGASPEARAVASGYFYHLAGTVNPAFTSGINGSSSEGLGPSSMTSVESVREGQQGVRDEIGRNSAAVEGGRSQVESRAGLGLAGAGAATANAASSVTGGSGSVADRNAAQDVRNQSVQTDGPASFAPPDVQDVGDAWKLLGTAPPSVGGDTGSAQNAASNVMFSGLGQPGTPQMPQPPVDGSGNVKFDSQADWNAYTFQAAAWANDNGVKGVSGAAMLNYLQQNYKVDEDGSVLNNDGTAYSPTVNGGHFDHKAFIANPVGNGGNYDASRNLHREFDDRAAIRSDVLNNDGAAISPGARTMSAEYQNAENLAISSGLAWAYRNNWSEHNDSPAYLNGAWDDRVSRGVDDPDFGSAKDASLFAATHFNSPYHEEAAGKIYFSEGNVNAFLHSGDWTSEQQEGFRDAVRQDLAEWTDRSQPMPTDNTTGFMEGVGFSSDPDRMIGPSYALGGQFSENRNVGETPPPSRFD